VKNNREDEAARQRRREVEERAMGRDPRGLFASTADANSATFHKRHWTGQT